MQIWSRQQEKKKRIFADSKDNHPLPASHFGRRRKRRSTGEVGVRGPCRSRSVSAPATLPPPRRNWIRQSQMATQHNHDHQRRRRVAEERLAHSTLQRPAPLHLQGSDFYPKKCDRNAFPDQTASGKVPEYPLPPHPNEKEFSTPPLYPPRLPSPSTFLLLPALQQMALSLQTMCPFRNLVPALSKPFQGHRGSSPSPSQSADPTPDTAFFLHRGCEHVTSRTRIHE